MANKLESLAGMSKKATAMPAMPARDMKYEAREALHTIHKAEEHKKDKELMRCVKTLAKGQMKAVCK